MKKQIINYILVVILVITFLSFMRGDIFSWNIVVPVNDYSANDIIIQDAKRFRLWHGNYSRVGFYHPGPFYFQIMALSEFLFKDLLGVMQSYTATHIFGWLIYVAFALVGFYFSLVSLLNSKLKAIASVVVTVLLAQISIGAGDYYNNQFFLVAPWPPFMYMVTMFVFLTSLVYMSIGRAIGVFLFIFSLLTLIHGHASFVGLAPMIAVSVVCFLAINKKKFPCLNGCLKIFFSDRKAVVALLVMILLFALPIMADAINNWPGQFPSYFGFARSGKNLYLPSEYLNYLGGFWHWSFVFCGIGIALFVNGRNSNLFSLLALVIFSIVPAALFYLIKGLDSLSYRYPLFWIAPVISFASVIAIIALIEELELKFIGVFIPVLLLVSLNARSLGFNRAPEVIAGGEYIEAVEKIRELSLANSLVITVNKNEILPIVMSTTIVALDKRMGAKSFCVNQDSWDMAYSKEYLCDSSRRGVEKYIYVTKGDAVSNGTLLFSAGALRGYVLN